MLLVVFWEKNSYFKIDKQYFRITDTIMNLDKGVEMFCGYYEIVVKVFDVISLGFLEVDSMQLIRSISIKFEVVDWWYSY